MRFLLPLLCLAILLSGCSAATKNTGPQDIALIGPNQQIVAVSVEVADSPEEWTQGLSNRKKPLADGTGMLFVFPESSIRTFWMKDTHFPLDILFFDSLGKVAHIDRMVPCTEDPCPQHSSTVPSSVVLEVPAGYVERSGISTGWQLALPAK